MNEKVYTIYIYMETSNLDYIDIMPFYPVDLYIHLTYVKESLTNHIINMFYNIQFIFQ